MGMNIYTLDGIHIGKRWAAGVWCWDCRKRAKRVKVSNYWRCPECGAVGQPAFYPVMGEFGFDKSKHKEHTGIDGACGFSWQIGESGLGKNRPAVKKALKLEHGVRTEYGEEWSMEQFWQMFDNVIVEESVSHDFT